MITYAFELCLKKGINNQNFFFDPDSSVKKLFKSTEVHEIEEILHQIESIKHTFIPSYGEDVIEDFQSIS